MLISFAESTSGIGALGIDLKALVIQLVSFLLAFWVLQRYAFKPILKIMDERRKTIEAGVQLGEQMKKDKAELESKVEAALHKARQNADKIIAEAQENSRQTIREAEEKAREKANSIMQEAEDRIAADTKRARKALESELVNLISNATETIIGEKVDAKKDAQLIDRALKERQAA